MPARVAIAVQLVQGNGPRADERHFTAQHVNELRQLVQAETAQPLAERSDARVVRELMVALPLRAQRGVLLEQPLQRLLGVDSHRAELDAREHASAAADPEVR